MNLSLRFTLLTLFVCAGLASIKAQNTPKHTLTGYVSDAETGEELIAATVYDRKTFQGTTANNYGFYSLTLASDSVDLAVTYLGYEPFSKKFLLNSDATINVKLLPQTTLKEVEIVADRVERIEDQVQMSRIDVPIEMIKKAPTLLGERDVLKVLQFLPGVSGGGEGQSGLYVRGGGPDQNLILLDGVPVYNASHLFGFFSVFNADAVKDVTLTKGGFPARYGGRLSSVIEINMKEGNENEFHGEGAIGLIASRLTLEGPIKKGKSSFLISGRRTYIDILTQPLIKKGLQSEGSDGKIGYFFHDVNAKVNWTFSDKDRVYLSVYGGKDEFYLDITEKDADYNFGFKNNLGWGNTTTALRWNHILRKKLFANTTLTYSRYKFDTGLGASEKYVENGVNYENRFDVNYFSGIDDLGAKVDFDYVPAPDHYIKFGAAATYHTFKPGKFTTSFYDNQEMLDQKTTFGQNNLFATETGLYVEDDWKVNSRFRTNFGLHFSSFFAQGKTYNSLQPRFNMRYLLNKGWALKSAFSTMQQYIHLLTNETIGLPTDLWLPATQNVRPQSSWQAAIGTAKTFGDGYEFSVELYYKEMNNVIAFKEGASLFQFSNWEERITQGQGTAYGSEFFLQKKKGRLNGWIGYTLSKTDRQFDDLNLGRRFPYKYDRRHDFEILASYELNKRISLSSAWVFSTGNAVTLASSKYYDPEIGVIENTTERNNFRYQNYTRFDIGIDFKKQKKRHLRTWSFGAYNASNRKNPFFLYLDTDYIYDANGQGKATTKLKQASLFPIIPYFSYGFKF